MNNKLIEKNGKKYLPTGQMVTDIIADNNYIVEDEKGFRYGTDISGEYLYGLGGSGYGEFDDDEDDQWLEKAKNFGGKKSYNDTHKS